MLKTVITAYTTWKEASLCAYLNYSAHTVALQGLRLFFWADGHKTETSEELIGIGTRGYTWRVYQKTHSGFDQVIKYTIK